MTRLEVWIPIAPKGPNRRASTLQGRIRDVRLERTHATLSTRDAMRKRGVKPFDGPVRIKYELRRVRLLDEDNAWASLKHYIDGVGRAALLCGDGPKGILLSELVQVQVANGLDGLYVMIEQPEAGDARGRPFSGDPV